MTAAPGNRLRILHFVTGGGSGATRVAIDLALRQHADPAFAPLLALRRKRQGMPAAMLAEIHEAQLPLVWIDDLWPKHRTVNQLVALCHRYQPHAFLAHGNSEHLWGRLAAHKAGVPVKIHIEQNVERYSWLRRRQGRRLAIGTSATVCVSQGVADHVRRHGLASPRVEVIHNGTDITRFSQPIVPLSERSPDIIMAARFARQKDHATLIRATRRLVDTGWTGQLLLAGGGKPSHRHRCEKLVQQLGLSERVTFLGLVADMPARLHRCRVAVLSTHYEGLPLALTEAMAAGCAVVASAAPGVTDIVQDGVNGWLFPIGDDVALAAALHTALDPASAQARTDRGRSDALTRFSQSLMVERYNTLIHDLLAVRRVCHIGVAPKRARTRRAPTFVHFPRRLFSPPLDPIPIFAPPFDVMPFDANTIAAFQSELTATWHAAPPAASGEGFLRLVSENHLRNFELWHEEDIARREDLGFERVYRAKRAIDRFNQQRNNFMEAMDQAIATELQPPLSGCPRNSETPGMMIDRLSILGLKEYHMREETQRAEATPQHRETCATKLARIIQQRGDLVQCLAELLTEVAARRRTFSVYFQFKMYNDPGLNPQLYQSAAAPSERPPGA